MGEDLGTYPRQEKKDISLLKPVGCDLVYIPKAGSMYSNDHGTSINVGGAALGLETDYRPHFFGGVAIVVTKLLNRVQPDIAVFGKKDYQQYLTIKRLTMDLDIPVKIIGLAGLRSHDSRRWQSQPHLSVSLAYVRDIFEYLHSRNIGFYRLSGQLAPYLTHPDMPQFHRHLRLC